MYYGDDYRRLIADALQLAQKRYGRPVRGAQFKLLLRDLVPGFDERSLGYPNLRVFLEKYPDIVTVNHDGYDIVPQAPDANGAYAARTVVEDATPNPAQSVDVSAAGPKLKIIRSDIWRAFTLVDPSTVRYYDREDGRAVMLGRQEVEGEPEATQTLRKTIASAPDRFVPIMPISADEPLSEMRAFIGRLPSHQQSHRAILESSLSSFTIVLFPVPGVDRSITPSDQTL